MMKLSRSRRASTALVFGVAFLGVIVVTAMQITRSLIATSVALTSSHRLLGQISLVRALLVQIDESVDAYVLTGKNETLAPLEAARTDLTGALEELEKQALQTPSPPTRAQEIGELRPLVQEKLALAEDLVRIRSTQGFDAARRAFLDPRRDAVVAKVASLLTRLTEDERDAAEDRAESRAFRAQIEVVVVVLGGVLSFGLVAFAVHLLRREISERRRAERAVEENAALLRSVTDGTADLVFLKDLDGRYRMVNPAFAQSLEATPDQILGRFDRDVLPPPAPDADPRGTDTSVIRDGRTVSFEETRIIGGYARTFLSTKALQRGADGQPIGIIGIARDITDRIRAEAELRDSEQRFRALSTASPTGIWRCDPRGRCTYTNPQWQRMSGLTHEESLGTGWTRVVHPDDVESVRDFFRRAAARGEEFGTDLRILRPDGEIRWVTMRGAPVLTPNGEITGYVGTADDITERRTVEENLRAANTQLERQRKELQVLFGMGELLQACQSSDEAYPIVEISLEKLLVGTTGWIAMISASRNAVEPVLAWGGATRNWDPFSPGECWALRRGKPHVVVRPSDGPRCAHLDEFPDGGYLCVPMMAQGEALGVLHVRGLGAGEHAIDPQLVGNAADHLALALANVHLRETLRNQSIRDPLSSVYNRRFMEESLDREVQRAQRRGWPIGLIMLDLDHFKSFNDNFGHEAGDAIIRALGSFLQARVRASDIVCRYGGEEFVIILPESAVGQTLQRAELLCRDLRATSFKVDDRALGPITLSAGVAVLPDHAANAAELLRSADAALYRAKEQGRDQVVVAEARVIDPNEPPPPPPQSLRAAGG